MCVLWSESCRRIIPAYAGLTDVLRSGAACKADHPRLRGVNEFKKVYGGQAAGSSPLTRG